MIVLLAVETSSKQGSLTLLKSEGTPPPSSSNTLSSPSSLIRGNHKPFYSLLAEQIWNTDSSPPHSEVITLHLIEALKQAQIKLSQLDLLSVSIGPGSFTGLRVGLNMISSLSFAGSLPILPVNSLRVLSQAALQKKGNFDILCLFNAQRESFYAALFEKKENHIYTKKSPCLIGFSQLLKWTQNTGEFQNTNSKERFQKDILLEKPSSLKRDASSFPPCVFLCLGDGYALLQQDSHFFPLIKGLERDPSITDFPLARHLGEVAFENYTKHQPLSWREIQPLYIRASSAEEKLGKS